MGPRREAGTDARSRGTNPRAKGTNPRRNGTNPSAGTSSDIARVDRLRRRAIARYRIEHGEPFCPACDDTGWQLVREDLRGEQYRPCPDHRTMTANEADDLLSRGVIRDG